MKKVITNVGRKVFWFIREVGNLIGNLFVPVASILVGVAELLQAPVKVIKALKDFEYWLFKIGGTLPVIEKAVDEVEKVLDKYADAD